MKHLLFLFLFIGFLLGCKRDIVTVIDGPQRVSISSLFAINDDRRATLGWTPVFNGTARELVIYRSSNVDFVPSAATQYTTVQPSEDRFVDTSVQNGLLYYYRLVPVEELSNGMRRNGAPSNVALGRPFDYNNITSINYSNHIQAIFNSSCAVHACHVGFADEGGDSFEGLQKVLHGGEFSLKSWEDVFEGSDDGAVVVPYKSTKSDLFIHVNDDTTLGPALLDSLGRIDPLVHMPQGGFQLPRAQLLVLKRWIDEGAPNDQGAVAYSSTPRQRMFVVNALEDLIAVIDIAKNFVIRYVNVGRAYDSTFTYGSPHHVKADEAGRYFYATLINARQLWKFSATTYEFLERVTIPPAGSSSPADVVFSSTGDTAFISDFNSGFGTGSGRITMVDTRSMQVIGTITLINPIAPFPPTLPHGLLLSPDKSRLFVTNSGTGNVSMIRLADMSQMIITLDTSGSSSTTPASPYLCDITPDGRYLFVTDYSGNAQNVYVIDFLRDSTKAWKAIPIGGRSVHVAVTPDGRYAYVCNFTNHSVVVIDILDFSVTSILIPQGYGRQPHGVVFTPDGTAAYITTENLQNPDPPHHPTAGGTGTSFVLVIDVATKRITKKIEVGAWGQGIAYSP